MNLSPVERNNCEIKDECITHVFIMAETSGDNEDAGSDTGHSFTINEDSFDLYDRKPGDDMSKNKTDLWKFTAAKVGVRR